MGAVMRRQLRGEVSEAGGSHPRSTSGERLGAEVATSQQVAEALGPAAREELNPSHLGRGSHPRKTWR